LKSKPNGPLFFETAVFLIEKKNLGIGFWIKKYLFGEYLKKLSE